MLNKLKVDLIVWETCSTESKMHSDTTEKAADSAKIADRKNYTGSNNLNEKRNSEKGRKEPMNREDICRRRTNCSQ